MNQIIKSFCLLLAAALVAVVILPAMAAETKGKVKTVTPALKRFVLTDQNGKDWVMELHPQAKITLAGKASKLDDLKRGDEITINYDKEGEKLIVKEIVRK